MESVSQNRCPVCRAPFRESVECSRCGADLRPLFVLAASAYECRQQARQAILRGDFKGATLFAARARALCDTAEGRRLEVLAQWLLDSK